LIHSKRILVTGGAGFIGSHTCDKLIANDNEIIVVDNLSSGYEKNIKHLADRIEFYRESIETFDLAKIKRLDGIIHLAAQTSVPISVEKFRSSSTTNINGFLNLIDFSKDRQLPLVYASSSAVYGNLSNGDDTSSETNLINPYAVDKYAMELYGKMSHYLYKLPNIGLRFFNVYGKRQDPSSQYSGVISVFINQMKNNLEVTIHGGQQTRDFIYVSDVVNTISSSLAYLFEELVYDQINVLTGQSTSIEELYHMLADLLKYNKKPIYSELLKGDPLESGGTIVKMKEILSLDPKEFVTLNEGLLETINSQ